MVLHIISYYLSSKKNREVIHAFAKTVWGGFRSTSLPLVKSVKCCNFDLSVVYTHWCGYGLNTFSDSVTQVFTYPCLSPIHMIAYTIKMDAIQYRMQIVPQYHFSAAKAFDYGQSMVLTVGEANERFLGLLEPMGTKPHLLHTKRWIGYFFGPCSGTCNKTTNFW